MEKLRDQAFYICDPFTPPTAPARPPLGIVFASLAIDRDFFVRGFFSLVQLTLFFLISTRRTPFPEEKEDFFWLVTLQTLIPPSRCFVFSRRRRNSLLAFTTRIFRPTRTSPLFHIGAFFLPAPSSRLTRCLTFFFLQPKRRFIPGMYHRFPLPFFFLERVRRALRAETNCPRERVIFLLRTINNGFPFPVASGFPNFSSLYLKSRKRLPRKEDPFSHFSFLLVFPLSGFWPVPPGISIFSFLVDAGFRPQTLLFHDVFPPKTRK